MYNILIVEDDPGLNQGIALSLKREEYQFYQAFTISEAREKWENAEIQLIILDINLPDGNGFDFCKEIRIHSDVPVLFLTANDMEIDIVTGLEIGADDYMTKPFSLMILRARVSALLRRYHNDQERIYEIEPYRFNFDKMEFFIGGRAVELSKTEQKLLKIFVMNQGQTLKREMLVDRIWTDVADYVDENALSVTVKRLRTKLEDDFYIKTVYGIGYMWRKA